MSQVRFIAGSGRSGTTWILDALAVANGLRPVFEPLNPFASSIGRRYAHRALRPEESHNELKEFLDDVFTGQRERLWTQYRRQRNWLLPTRDMFGTSVGTVRLGRRWFKFLKEAPGLAALARFPKPLVKCIFANQMLDWLRLHCQCQILFVVRHPAAVIESELRSGWNPTEALDRFRSDTVLHASTGDRYRRLLAMPMTPVESLAAKWVVENQPVVEGPCTSGITLVFYELLAASEQASWKTVLNALNLEHAPDARHLAQPSQQSAPYGSSSRAGARGEPTWKSALTRVQIAEIQGILDSVRFTAYSTNDVGPQVDCQRAGVEATERSP